MRTPVGHGWVTLSLLLVALLLTSVVLVVPVGAASPKTLRIGFMPVEDELPLYIAEHEGRFKAAGLDVQLITFASAVERDTAFRAGQVDGIVTDLIATCYFKKSGMDVVITSITLGATPQEGRFAILVGPKSKITSVKDLKNVPIGVSRNTIVDFVTDQLLRQGGLKPGEIKKVDIPKIPIRLEMLLSGQLEAVALPDPMAALAEYRGARVIASDTDSRRNLSPIVYLWHRKTLREKGEALATFYRVYREVVKELNANPEKYRRLLVENARVPEQIKEVYPIPRFPQPTLPQKEDVALAVQWMREQGLISKEYSYEELVDDRFVR